MYDRGRDKNQLIHHHTRAGDLDSVRRSKFDHERGEMIGKSQTIPGLGLELLDLGLDLLECGLARRPQLSMLRFLELPLAEDLPQRAGQEHVARRRHDGRLLGGRGRRDTAPLPTSRALWIIHSGIKEKINAR